MKSVPSRTAFLKVPLDLRLLSQQVIKGIESSEVSDSSSMGPEGDRMITCRKLLEFIKNL